MSRRPRRNHSAAFKAKVAIEALADDKTIAEVAQKHDVHPNQVTEWRRQLMERAAGVFGGAVAPEAPPVDLKALHTKIGQLTLEKDFLEGALSKVGLLSAKRLNRSRSRATDQAPGAVAGYQPWHGVLPPRAGQPGATCADASHRRAALGAPVRG